MSLKVIGTGHSTNDGYNIQTLESTYDFALTSASANAVIELIQIPAGSIVNEVIVEVLTVEDGGTFDIGDGNDVDGYHDGISATVATTNSLSLVLSEAAPNTVLGYSNGQKLYTATDSIDIKVLGQTFDEMKIRVRAIVTRTSN